MKQLIKVGGRKPVDGDERTDRRNSWKPIVRLAIGGGTAGISGDERSGGKPIVCSKVTVV